MDHTIYQGKSQGVVASFQFLSATHENTWHSALASRSRKNMEAGWHTASTTGTMLLPTSSRPRTHALQVGTKFMRTCACVTKRFFVSMSCTCFFSLLHSGSTSLKGFFGSLLDLQEIRGKNCPANEDEAGECGRIIFLSWRFGFSPYSASRTGAVQDGWWMSFI